MPELMDEHGDAQDDDDCQDRKSNERHTRPSEVPFPSHRPTRSGVHSPRQPPFGVAPFLVPDHPRLASL